MNLDNFFTKEDFDVFLIDGLDNRMEALQAQIRPKFKKIGDQIVPFLTSMLEEPVTMHIAKHARRTINPPEETWIAWSTNRRGYKAHPHFQVGLNKDYLFICFALIYECPKKALFAHNLRSHLGTIWPQIPSNYYISPDHTKPDFMHNYDLTEKSLNTLLERLANVKKAEFLCGLQISRENSNNFQEENLLTQIRSTFETVYPLYLLAKEGD